MPIHFGEWSRTALAVLSRPLLSCPVPSYPVLSYPVLACPTLSLPDYTSLHLTSLSNRRIIVSSYYRFVAWLSIRTTNAASLLVCILTAVAWVSEHDTFPLLPCVNHGLQSSLSLTDSVDRVQWIP